MPSIDRNGERMIKIERLDSVEPTEEGTVFHYRAAGRRGSLCIPPRLIPVLLATLLETAHSGIGDEFGTVVPAAVKLGIATDVETGQPVVGMLFENKLRIAIETDEALIAALEGVVGELKKKKRH